MNRKRALYHFRGITREENHFSDTPKSSLLAHFENADTGERLTWNETYARSVLMEVEAIIDRLGEVNSWQELHNRVQAGFKLPPFIEKAQIDPERVAFALDLMKGSLGAYPPVDVRTDIQAANPKRFMRQQKPGPGPQGPEPA